MRKLKSPFKVKPISVVILLSGITLMLLINILSRFGLFDFTLQQTNIITLIGAIFLISETSIYAIMRKLRRGVNSQEGLDIFIGVVGVLALIGVGFNMFGVPLQILQPIQGLVDIGLLIFTFIEMFRRN